MKKSVDRWSLDFNLNVFLQDVALKGWQIFDLKVERDHLVFYALPQYRKSIKAAYPQACLLYTCGIWGMVKRSFWRIDRWVGLLCCFACWWCLSTTTFSIEIRGEGEANRSLIRKILDDAQIVEPINNLDKADVKNLLNGALDGHFSWLEVSQQGSAMMIRFLPKKRVEAAIKSKDALIAKKDGVIAFFDLKHGEKKVAIHDVVHEGDVLVENYLIDSMNQTENLFVEGRVYAYTWKDFVLEAEGNQFPEALNYFKMILQARREVAKEIDDGERIIAENVLHFSSNRDKIILEVHYTLYEDISS